MPEDTVHVALFLALVFLPLWKRYGWLQLFCGLGVMALSARMMGDELEYGLPFFFIGLMISVIAIFRWDKMGTD